jgi:hypothetical protein
MVNSQYNLDKKNHIFGINLGLCSENSLLYIIEHNINFIKNIADYKPNRLLIQIRKNFQYISSTPLDKAGIFFKYHFCNKIHHSFIDSLIQEDSTL